jgi:hypothetical protein
MIVLHEANVLKIRFSHLHNRRVGREMYPSARARMRGIRLLPISRMYKLSSPIPCTVQLTSSNPQTLTPPHPDTPISPTHQGPARRPQNYQAQARSHLAYDHDTRQAFTQHHSGGYPLPLYDLLEPHYPEFVQTSQVPATAVFHPHILHALLSFPSLLPLPLSCVPRPP